MSCRVAGMAAAGRKGRFGQRSARISPPLPHAAPPSFTCPPPPLVSLHFSAVAKGASAEKRDGLSFEAEPDGKTANEMESQKARAQQNVLPCGKPDLPLSSFELAHTVNRRRVGELFLPRRAREVEKVSTRGRDCVTRAQVFAPPRLLDFGEALLRCPHGPPPNRCQSK